MHGFEDITCHTWGHGHVRRLCSRCRVMRRDPHVLSHVVYNLSEGLKLGHGCWVHIWKLRRALGHRAEDLDALDGVHTEVGLKLHFHGEHIRGIAGLLSDDFEEEAIEVKRRCGRRLDCDGCWRRLLGWCRCFCTDNAAHMLDNLAEGL